MKPIGEHPFRKLESFGISGLLGEEARVFYNTVFNTRNLGRTTDLLAARLAKSGVDELRLRQVLILSVFEAYRLQIGEVLERKKLIQERAQAKAAAEGKPYVPKEEEDKLDQPITIECGVDNEKIGVSLIMPVPDSEKLDPGLLVARINSREVVSDFEKLGLQISDASDCLAVRYQPETRRIEFAALISFESKVQRQPVELVTITVEDAKRSPKPLEYTEAGDLDYESLLEDDTRVGGKKGKGFTNALVKKAKDKADGNSRITAGSDDEDDDSLSVGNEGFEANGQNRIRGKKGKGSGTGGVSVDGQDEETQSDSTRFSADRQEATVEDQTVFDSDSSAVTVKKKKVSGRKVFTESEEAEVEADEITEGGTSIKFKGSQEKSEDDSSDVTISGGSGAVKKRAKLKVHQSKAALEEDESEEEEEFVIEGETQKKEKQSKITFKAGAIEEGEEESEEVAYGRGGRRLKGTRAAGEEEIVEEELQGAAPIKRMRKLIRRIWPFGKKADQDASDESHAEAQDSSTQVIASEEKDADKDEMLVRFKGEKGSGAKEHEYTFKAGARANANGDGKEKDQDYGTPSEEGKSAETAAAAGAEPQSESDQILKTFEEKVIDKTVDRIQREAVKLKDEIKDERTKRWVDNLSRDLIAEKANLRETAKRISENVRKKEHEFKTKSMALEEQLRKREEEVAQKNSALTRTREQLTQVTRSIERMKQLTQEAADAASFKQKYALTQKVLQTTKDENTLLQAKIEEMKNQITNLQLGGKNKGPSQTEFNVLQTKYDRSYKQIDDLKRQNQKLLSEIGAKRGVGAGAESAELKKKVEAAQRMQMIAKKENEILQERVAKMQRDDRNLRSEIARLQEALKNSSIRRGGGGKAA